MSRGNWIKVFRNLRDSPYYTESKAIHVWIECLLRASFTKQEVFLKREKITLHPGQFVMGREEFGRKIGMSGSTVWYWINQFETDSMIDIKKTAKGSLVTIKNWKKYQRPDSTSDNKKTSKKHQKNTIKKVKNSKKVKNVQEGISIYHSEETSQGDKINSLIELFRPINPAYTRLFSNKTQRASLERLLKQLGQEKLVRTIEYVISVNGEMYAPIITTPYQLEQKMGELMAFYKKQNTNNTVSNIKF